MPLHDNPDSIPTKQCAQCKTVKPATLGYFPRRADQKDELSYYCKKCNNDNARKWTDANREKKRQGDRDRYKANPEPYKLNAKKWRAINPDRKRELGRIWSDANREQERERKRKWERNNPDAVRQASRKKYIAHKERIEQRNREWAAANPEARRAIWTRRRARKRALPNIFTSIDRQRALGYFEALCAVCQRPTDGSSRALHIDHWIPLSSPDCPGTIPGNMVPLCGGADGCNNSKGSKNPRQWLIDKFGQAKAAEIMVRVEAYFASLANE
jgi:hypothetical protein